MVKYSAEQRALQTTTVCRPVHHEVEFDVGPKEICDTYLDSRRHARSTGRSATMSQKEGGGFGAADGYISGFNLELLPGNRFVQGWRASEGPDGVFSVLRLELQPRGGGSRRIVDHVGIPDEFREGVDQGW
jgi:hypothetical protein